MLLSSSFFMICLFAFFCHDTYFECILKYSVCFGLAWINVFAGRTVHHRLLLLNVACFTFLCDSFICFLLPWNIFECIPQYSVFARCLAWHQQMCLLGELVVDHRLLLLLNVTFLIFIFLSLLFHLLGFFCHETYANVFSSIQCSRAVWPGLSLLGEFVVYHRHLLSFFIMSLLGFLFCHEINGLL